MKILNTTGGGLIREMISKDDFDPNLMVILLNSVYFESPWINKWRLTQHSFTDLSGNTAEKEMLEDDLDTYYENEYATAFSKNYYNGFQFIGILPKTEGDFQLGDLDLGSLLESETQDYKVKAIAPKMNYETETKNVIGILEAQGVHRAFHENDAEFNNMIDDENCYINKIIQKCKIELDEKGTRAAASTAITMKKGLLYNFTGNGKGKIFKHGEVIRTVPEGEIVQFLVQEANRMADEMDTTGAVEVTVS